jgi:ADP-heptose:LPS heptosyltransferase
VIVASWNVGLVTNGWKLAPRVRYVLSDSMFRMICMSLGEQFQTDHVHSWSAFNSYERRYGGQDLSGRRLAIYRENGFGDNLIVSALAGYLKHQFPTCTIDLFAVPRVGPVWIGNTDVSFLDVPPSFDAIRNGYDYHLLFEGIMENDCEPDQGNAYDNMFSIAGIYPKSVPANFKRPQIFWTESDQQAEDEWTKIRPSEDYIVCHWNPSGLVRQYPYDLYRAAILMLSERLNVVVVGDTEGGIPNLEIEHPKVHNWINRTPGFRSILPMLKQARAILCADSSVLHLSACFPDVPTVALYGAFAHSDRSLYYPNTIPIHAQHVCPSAPCRTQKSALPVARCQQAEGWQEGEKFCRAMWALTPERVVETVWRALR